FFFFSSRRRHTRSYGDWSSDVCSSDLWRLFRPKVQFHRQHRRFFCLARQEVQPSADSSGKAHGRRPFSSRTARETPEIWRGSCEIGRASCRERVEMSAGGGCWKETEKE